MDFLVIVTVASMLFFINCVFLFKRMIEKKDIAFNTIGGAVLFGIMVFTSLGFMTMR